IRRALEDDVRLLQAAPDIDYRLAAEIELAIRGVRRTQNEQVAARDNLVERPQFRIGGDEGVGGKHRSGVALQRLLELVAERRASVVDIGLEGHAEQSDGELGELATPV